MTIHSRRPWKSSRPNRPRPKRGRPRPGRNPRGLRRSPRFRLFRGGMDRTFWPSFAAGLRGKVPPAVFPYLNNPAKVTGVRQNDRLTLWVDSEFTRSVLNKPAVLEKLAQAAGGLFGGLPQVSVAVGTPPAPSAPPEADPLDALMSFGGLDNVTIQ